MKSFVFFLLGLIVGATAYHFYGERETYATADQVQQEPSLAARTGEKAANVRDAVADKFAEWHLTPEEIKADLRKTGEVVRAKSAVAGEKISDARIVTVIKSKYVLDRHLSALDINVDCTAGVVTLRGTVAVEEYIARAVVLALETDGVLSVSSKLTPEVSK